MIKAVIFDWGGVLIDDPHMPMREFLARRLGVERDRLIDVYDKHYHDLFQTGSLTEAEVWKKVCGSLGVRVPTSLSLWREAVEHAFRDRKEVFNFVSELKGKGIKTGFLSNTEKPTMQYFQDNGYGKFFDATVFSCAEGIAKPDDRIYRIALDRLGVKPEEAVFIDDKPEYAEAATKIGMKGVLFRGLESLIHDINIV